jgi:hypothetical protein
MAFIEILNCNVLRLLNARTLEKILDQIIRIELSRFAAVVGFRVVGEAVYDPIAPADAGGTAAP